MPVWLRAGGQRPKNISKGWYYCKYGLGAVFLLNDAKKIKQFFDDVKTGTIWINDPLTEHYAGPFGGMKYSGGARVLGEEGLDQFREAKHVHWDFNLEDKDYWYPYERE